MLWGYVGVVITRYLFLSCAVLSHFASLIDRYVVRY